MPLYEYECDACHQRFEKIQKFSDPPEDVCQKCGKGPVRKLFSSPAIQFKGTGWYVTDYAKGNGKSQPAKEGKQDAKKEGSSSSTDSSAKTESKTSSTTPAGTSDKKV